MTPGRGWRLLAQEGSHFFLPRTARWRRFFGPERLAPRRRRGLFASWGEPDLRRRLRVSPARLRERVSREARSGFDRLRRVARGARVRFAFLDLAVAPLAMAILRLLTLSPARV